MTLLVLLETVMKQVLLAVESCLVTVRLSIELVPYQSPAPYRDL